MSAPPSDSLTVSRENDVRYRVLVEATSQGLWIWDPATKKGDFESMRRWWHEATGQQPRERFWEGWLETVHPDDRERVSDTWRHALNTGDAVDIEHRLVGRDGVAVHVRARGIPIRNTDGSVREWVGMVADLSAQKRAEAAMRESAALLSVIGQAAPAFLWVNDTAGENLYINPSWFEYTGTKPGDLKDFGYMNALHPDDRPIAIAEAQEARRDDKPFEGEFRYRRHDGEYRWFAARSLPVRNEAGEVTRRVGVAVDIHDRKVAEIHNQQLAERVRQSEERLRIAQEGAKVGTWEIAYTSGEVIWSDEIYRMFGYQPGEVSPTAENWMKHIHPEDLERATRDLASIRDLGADYRGEFRVVHKDGQTRWLASHGRTLRDAAGRALRTIGINIDITDRKAHEEQLRALNETLEQRVAERTAQLRALAHELTQAEQRERKRIAQALHDDLAQSLAICRMKLSMIPVAAVQSEWARTLAEANERLGEAIHQTRTLMHEMSPPMLYDLGLGAAIGGLVERMYQQHGLKVEVQASGQEALDDNLRAFLFQAVRELLINVVKYARTDTATVRIAQSGDTLTLTVADQGAGFEPAALTWLPTEGGGFGLFNVRERLQLLGGGIDIESAPGRGARVTLWAPVVASHHATPTSSAERPYGPADADGPAGRIRVLLADDHKLLRDGVASLLAGLPDIAIAGEAEDGLAAIEQARRLQPDVVLMDISMPRLNGIEATRLLSKEMPHVKVIGLSMHSESDVAASMRSAGAVAYLNKGGPAEALIEAIREHAKAGVAAKSSVR